MTLTDSLVALSKALRGEGDDTLARLMRLQRHAEKLKQHSEGERFVERIVQEAEERNG